MIVSLLFCLQRRRAGASIGFGSPFRSRRAFLMKPFDLTFEMQPAALQVGDAEVIGRVLQPRLGNFVLQGFAPAF